MFEKRKGGGLEWLCCSWEHEIVILGTLAVKWNPNLSHLLLLLLLLQIVRPKVFTRLVLVQRTPEVFESVSRHRQQSVSEVSVEGLKTF